MRSIPANNRLLILPGVVIKMYREAWRAQNERDALRRLDDARILAPSERGSGRIGSRKFLVMSRLRGSTADGTEEAARRIIAYLRSVHELGGPGFGRLCAPLLPRWNDYVCQRLISYRKAFVSQGLHEGAGTADALTHLRLPEPPVPSLLHNDPEPGNFLEGPSGIAGLDWELAIYGDPDLDYARIGYALGIRPARLVDLLDDQGVAFNEQALTIYRRVHLLGRLMSSITAAPPDMAAAQRYLRDLRACANDHT
ncbi:phosphotransferase [Micromonospora eburnea]|uniref:Phosphotransferase enzyme family protein n=2 Tax=Micromonospora eburnea TaxID=227316 RepID=A0A1C6TSJ4_9ACTN|nr:Phosphotransferase enzyme family protein [Micromonospora eburnea]